MSKLALGTVQFGQDYGISNTSGKIDQEEAFAILDYAYDHGIHLLDTAFTYGTSEEIIGNYSAQKKRCFDIVTKVPQIEADNTINNCISESLKRLKADKVYACLFHNFQIYKQNPHLLEEIGDLKEKSIIEKAGFSLYYPKNLEILLQQNIPLDLVQIPMSLFDQRFIPWLDELKKRNIEVHVRSLFLQGLFFLSKSQIMNMFGSSKGSLINEKLYMLHELAKKKNISLIQILLGCIYEMKNVDKVVIGVENRANLIQNIDVVKEIERGREMDVHFTEFKIDDEQIIIPVNW